MTEKIKCTSLNLHKNVRSLLSYYENKRPASNVRTYLNSVSNQLT